MSRAVFDCANLIFFADRSSVAACLASLRASRNALRVVQSACRDGHEAPIPAVSTVWLVGRGDGLTALVPYPAVSRKGTFVSLDPGLMGLAASIPSDLGGTARWHLSRTFVNSCPSISIRIPSTMGIVDLTAPIPSTVVGRHVGSLPIWSFCRDVE